MAQSFNDSRYNRSPEFTAEEIVTTEVQDNVQRETKEQDRYFHRLNRANERQMRIFRKHFAEVMKPQEDEKNINDQIEDERLGLMQ